MPHSRKNKYGEIVFKDYPDFKPNVTPMEMFQAGSFGGTYWRPIYSSITKRQYKDEHKKFPKTWWIDIPEHHLTTPFDEYDKSINKYGVKVGTTLRFWEEKEWITKYHPYGWVQWYCDFYRGKRCPDDERQIERWQGVAGPNGRFRKWLVTLIKKKKGKYNDFSVSPRIRQTLLHWGYELSERDYEALK